MMINNLKCWHVSVKFMNVFCVTGDSTAAPNQAAEVATPGDANAGKLDVALGSLPAPSPRTSRKQQATLTPSQ